MKRKLYNKYRFKEKEKVAIIFSTLNKYYFKDLNFLRNLSYLDYFHVSLKKSKNSKFFLFLLEQNKFKGHVLKFIPRMTFKNLMKKSLINGVFQQKI